MSSYRELGGAPALNFADQLEEQEESGQSTHCRCGLLGYHAAETNIAEVEYLILFAGVAG